jgi:serine/threonine-protein kinase
VPFYYEPELALAVRSGAPQPRASALGEQFAVAAVVYRLLTGVHYRLFPLDMAAFWRAIAEEPPLAFTESWPAVETVLARALAKDPGDRYASLAAFAEAFRVASADASNTAPPHTPGERAQALVRTVIQDATDDHLGTLPVASVMHGAAGMAYMLYRVALGRADAALLALADLWAERARAPDAGARPEWVPPADRCAPVSPFHMISGVHAVRALIAHAAGDHASRRSALDDFVASSAGDHLDPDLTLGTAGVVLVSAMLVEATGEARAPLLEHGAAAARDLCRTLESLPAVDASPDLTATGAAHGWTGALFAAMRWYAATGAALPEAVRRRLVELAAHAEPRGRGVRWPWGFDDALCETYMGGWCNGTAGMVPMWTLAGRLTRETRFDDLADRCAWHTWEHAATHAGSTADLCCGDAGAAYALVARYQSTGEVAWLWRATALAERAVRRVDRVDGHDDMRRDSLYNGRIGVALLVADLDWPSYACMPFFGHEGWPTLAAAREPGA